MELIQVHMICAEPAEAVFHLLADALWRKASLGRINGILPDQSAFCCQEHGIPFPFECFSHYFFGMAEAVHSCGVDPVDAEIERPLNCQSGFLIVRVAPSPLPGAADCPCAKADLGEHGS